MNDIKQNIVNKAEEIKKALEKGNNVEIRRNPKGEIVILEVKKKNI